MPEHKNILWINMSAPSLGDSLMDLSSRIMLKDRNLDLFTDVKNAHLYKNDLIFSSVFTDKQQIKKNIYDLIIIDSYSTRSIRMKVNVAISTPFLGMFGYYNGPEVNRVLFSFHRMNKLLGYINNENEINCNAKCSISISSADKKIIQELKLPDNFIAIAIGGEWDYRTYQKWDSVIERIIKNDKKLNVVLLGSRNAKEIAKKIVYKNSYYNLYDYVDKFTFNQTSEIIKRAQVLLCCDGGLMHSANAVNTPIVALLAKLSPEMQLTNCIKAFSIYKNTNVNSISVDDICTKFQEASNFLNTNS
ncbi:lipopolysaccharide heptosyltransferase family protein [Candidatus Thioglobus sp.]|nr:lipopolysaccharide heptosyltransferase family protein [Candidatus Thioglobus sp.]